MKKIHSTLSILATVCLMLASLAVTAQNARLTGVVFDENGEPLIGAAVLVKGTTTGTTTGVDGSFTLDYPQGATLTVSYIGYVDQDVVPGNRARVEITLEPDSKLLDEVVVIGYGTVKRKDLTGSVASVRGEDLEAKKTTTLSTALQGAMSGVMVTRDNSAPGASAGSIRVRGITTIGTSDPLIIVDGVQVSSMDYVNPSDVQSISVLKDAAAASIYGSKAAAGVILITTRRNHSMATRITASLSAGVTLEPKYVDVMNASQYRSYASDLLKTTSTTIKDFKFLNEDPSYYYYDQYHNNTDWKDEVYHTAITQNYSINVEGGDDVADYNLSLGYITNQSTLRYNSMNRINIRFNSDIRLTQQFGIRFDASFANQTRNLRNDGAPANYTEGTPTSPAFLAYAKSPMLSPWTFANGKVRQGYIDVTDESYLDEALADYTNYNYKLANPLAVNDYGDAENKNRFENSMINLAVTPKYRFGRHLALSEHFSYNLVNTNEKLYIPLNGVPVYYVSSVSAYVDNEVRSMAGKQNSVMSDTRLDYDNRFGAHALHIFGGARVNWETYTLSSQLGYNTASDKMPSISSSLDHAQTSGNSDTGRLQLSTALLPTSKPYR